MPVAFALERDSRGSQVHVRDRRSGECLGCLEVGLFEVVRLLVLDEAGGGRRECRAAAAGVHEVERAPGAKVNAPGEESGER
jgi:hypothetical protein